MLGSRVCFAADDVTIRCQIRRSKGHSGEEWSDLQDVTCTMRKWHKTSDPGSASVVRTAGGMEHGPELVLTPQESLAQVCCTGDFSNPLQMSDRFASFGSANDRKNGLDPRRRSITPVRLREGPVGAEICIPLKTIVVIDMYKKGERHQCSLTTETEKLEFTMENRNGQDILLAFLKANLPRQNDKFLQRSVSNMSNQSESTATKSLDVEIFTANRMAERVERETMSEKIKRKVDRVFSSFEEITTALTDCACGCARETLSPGPSQHALEERDAPPRSYTYAMDALDGELSPKVTPELSLERFDEAEEEVSVQEVKSYSLPPRRPGLETSAY